LIPLTVHLNLARPRTPASPEPIDRRPLTR